MSSWSKVGVVAALLVGLLMIAPVPAEATTGRKATREAIKALPERWRVWLMEEVYPLITNEQRETFLRLETEAQRAEYEERLWVLWGRQSGIGSAFRTMYEDRLALCRTEYGNTTEDRARVLLLNGPPDGVVEARCIDVFQPLQFWIWQYVDGIGERVVVLFYRSGGVNDYRLWHAYESREVLYAPGSRHLRMYPLRGQERSESRCPNGATILDLIAAAEMWSRNLTMLRAMNRFSLDHGPESATQRFMDFTALLPEDAEPLEFDVKQAAQGSRGGLVRMGFAIEVPVAALGTTVVGDVDVVQLDVVGEISSGSRMVDRFRYLFSVPSAGQPLGLTFERFIRPGDYSLRLKVEDVHATRGGVTDLQFTVEPWEAETESALRAADDRLAEAATERLREDDSQQQGRQGSTVRLLGPEGDAVSGRQRFEALTDNRVARVRFLVNDREVLTKNRAPFEVDLDLGPVPRLTTVTAVALDRDGVEVDRQQLTFNVGRERFYIRLQPVSQGGSDQVHVRMDVNLPSEIELDRVEVYWNEEQLAVLEGPPYETTLQLTGAEEFGILRAVLYATDGNQAEDLQLVNAPLFGGEVEVQAVELPVTVLDRDGQPVENLGAERFRVLEDGVEQQISHFALHQDLPVRLGIVIDTSASMEETLPTVQKVVMGFLRDLLRPRDRAFIEIFSDRPEVLATFTADFEVLENALLSLYADRATALYDSILMGLVQFSGVHGRKAMVVLTDGEDTASTRDFDSVIAQAQRSGVTIYTIGVDLPVTEVFTRWQLKKLGEVTGGRAFFIDRKSGLDRIYAEIDRELRTQYLLAFTSSSERPPDELRKIEVEVDQPGVTVRTISGYYPGSP